MGSLESFRGEVREWLAENCPQRARVGSRDKLSRARFDDWVRTLGSRGLGWSGEGYEDAEIARTRRWLITRADSIWGGTSEVQRNIIAKRVLLIPE